MANTADEKISLGADLPGEPVSTAMQVIVPALGWLIPGAGHLLLKRWIRGGLLLVSIVAMRGSFWLITRLRPACLAPYRQASARRMTVSTVSPGANWATPMEMVMAPNMSPVDFFTSFLVSTVVRI